MLSHATKARLRLTAIALGLVPLAILARACYSSTLTEFVQVAGSWAWDVYDRATGKR